MWVAVLQTGVEPPHCAFDRHGTQVALAAKQTGVAPVHWVAFVAEHWAQAPPGWQAGVAPPHSPSPAQARQVWVAVLQTGVEPPHCAFDVHGTQTAAATSQAGVAPEHRVVFVAEHCAHAPLAWQAGVAPPHSLSPPQPRQVLVARLQIGVAPPHWAFDVHGTHVPVVVKQTGVAPPHELTFVAEHWPHDPPG